MQSCVELPVEIWENILIKATNKKVPPLDKRADTKKRNRYYDGWIKTIGRLLCVSKEMRRILLQIAIPAIKNRYDDAANASIKFTIDQFSWLKQERLSYESKKEFTKALEWMKENVTVYKSKYDDYTWAKKNCMSIGEKLEAKNFSDWGILILYKKNLYINDKKIEKIEKKNYQGSMLMNECVDNQPYTKRIMNFYDKRFAPNIILGVRILVCLTPNCSTPLNQMSKAGLDIKGPVSYNDYLKVKNLRVQKQLNYESRIWTNYWI